MRSKLRDQQGRIGKYSGHTEKQFLMDREREYRQSRGSETKDIQTDSVKKTLGDTPQKSSKESRRNVLVVGQRDHDEITRSPGGSICWIRYK